MQKLKFAFIAGFILLFFSVDSIAQRDTTSAFDLLQDRLRRGEVDMDRSNDNDDVEETVDTNDRGTSLVRASGMQKLFYKTVDDAIFLVRQDYGVRKSNGKVAVKPGKKYWGRAYGIGVMSKDRLYLHKNIQEPWRKDKSYMKVDEGKGKPFGVLLAMSDIADPDFKNIKVKNVEVNDQIGAYRFKDNKRPSVANSAGKTGGFMILYYTDDEVGPDMEVRKKVMSLKPKWKSGKKKKPKSAMVENKIKGTILGGAYFEQAVSTGKIEFKLAGLYDDGKIWAVANGGDEEEEDSDEIDLDEPQEREEDGFDG